MSTIAEDEAEKLRAFEQRMQQEGAAAFAAGPAPWEHWDDLVSLGTYRMWMSSLRRNSAPTPPPVKPLTTRLLTGLAQLAVLALLIGTTGVYVSIVTPDQQLAHSGIQPPPIVVAGRVSLRPVTAAQPVIRAPSEMLAAAAPAAAEAPAAAADDPQPAAAALAGTASALPAVTAPLVETPDTATEQTLAQTLDELPGTAAGPSAVAPPDTATPPPPVAAAPPPGSVNTAALDAQPDKPAEPPAARESGELDGTWVVNLASYNFESMAKRKLAVFHDKGVNAELVKVMIKGKPMIRIRTTGYRSRREASDWVTLLEERLGLQGAWVAKYEPGEE